MKRILLSGFLGGFLIFMWGAIAHMALPIGTMGVDSLPDEAATLSALKASVKEHGLYYFPGIDMSRTVSEAEQKAWEEKVHAGPVGLLIINPEGGEAMSPTQLGKEFATNVLSALVASLLMTRVVGGYASRVGFLTLVGLLGWLSISVPYWNWYGFPTDFTLAGAIEEGVGWTLAGLVIARLVPPPKA